MCRVVTFCEEGQETLISSELSKQKFSPTWSCKACFKNMLTNWSVILSSPRQLLCPFCNPSIICIISYKVCVCIIVKEIGGDNLHWNWSYSPIRCSLYRLLVFAPHPKTGAAISLLYARCAASCAVKGLSGPFERAIFKHFNSNTHLWLSFPPPPRRRQHLQHR